MGKLNTYKIEHKILSLTQCAVMKDVASLATFGADGIYFSHWDFNIRDGWKNDAWIAVGSVDAEKFIDAINIFGKKLPRIIPRIALISQSYIEYISEPFLISKIGSDIVFFRYTYDIHVGGLMFTEVEQEALNKLLDIKEIPENFYYYWNDAVNAVGYSAKLLLMFSALEALTKKDGKNDFDLRDKIFGKSLAEELYKQGKGIRHRLVHGGYFDDKDLGKDYLEIIHKKVILYFNNIILNKKLIYENIVNPQRHFFGNKDQGNFFLKQRDGSSSFNLKYLLKDFEDNGFKKPEKYESIINKQLFSFY